MNFILSGFSDEIDTDINIQFESIRKLGIKYFEPRGINGKNISELSDSEVNNLKNAMREYGIKVSSIGSPIGKISIGDDFAPHLEQFKRVVEIAKLLDCKYIRMFSFYMPGNEAPEKYKDEVLYRISKMIEYAKSENVVLLHENEKGIYGDTAKRCLDILYALACDNFKAVFDPANFVQCGQDTLDAYNMLSPYIEYMHIKDATEDGSVVPAGYGAGNVEFILKNLKTNNYSGFLSLEPHLGSFSGLERLEADTAMTKLKKSSEEKFIMAYNALKAILERI